MDLTKQKLEQILLPLAHKWELISRHLDVSVEELQKGYKEPTIDDNHVFMKRLIDSYYLKLKDRDTIRSILSECGEVSAADLDTALSSPAEGTPHQHHPDIQWSDNREHSTENTSFPEKESHSLGTGQWYKADMHLRPSCQAPSLIAANGRLERETKDIKARFTQILSDVLTPLCYRNPSELVALLEQYDRQVSKHSHYYSTLIKGCSSTDEIVGILTKELNLFDYDLLEFIARRMIIINEWLLLKIQHYSSEVQQFLETRLYNMESDLKSLLPVDAEMSINPDNQRHMRRLQSILQECRPWKNWKYGKIELLQVCALLKSTVNADTCSGIETWGARGGEGPPKFTHDLLKTRCMSS